MRVAIVGGPGIGKSTLVRQLADLYHNGAYGEGEEGVWDPRVLEDIDAGRNPVGVTAYFARLYDANYRDAAQNDRPGKVMFFEGARIRAECALARPVSDAVIVLAASPDGRTVASITQAASGAGLATRNVTESGSHVRGA